MQSILKQLLFAAFSSSACNVGSKVFAKPHASSFYEPARITAASPSNDRFKLQWEYQPLLCSDTSTTYNPLHHACLGCAQNCYRFSVEVTEYCSSSGRCRSCRAVQESERSFSVAEEDSSGLLSAVENFVDESDAERLVLWSVILFFVFFSVCYVVQIRGCLFLCCRKGKQSRYGVQVEDGLAGSDDVILQLGQITNRRGVNLDPHPGLGRRNWWETGKDALSFSWTRGATARCSGGGELQGAFGKPTTVLLEQGPLSRGTGVGIRNANGEANWPFQAPGAPEMIVVMHPTVQSGSRLSPNYQRSIEPKLFQFEDNFVSGQNSGLRTNPGSSRNSPSSPAHSRSATPSKRVSGGSSHLRMSDVVNDAEKKSAISTYRVSTRNGRPPRPPSASISPRGERGASTPRSEGSERSGTNSSRSRRSERRWRAENFASLDTPRDSERGASLDTPRDSERDSICSGGSRRIIRGRAPRKDGDVQRMRGGEHRPSRTAEPQGRNSRSSSKGSDSPRIVRGWDLNGGEPGASGQRRSWNQNRQREVERRLSSGSGIL